jgi:hypothetical protein
MLEIGSDEDAVPPNAPKAPAPDPEIGTDAAATPPKDANGWSDIAEREVSPLVKSSTSTVR